MNGPAVTTMDGVDLAALEKFFQREVPGFQGRLTAGLLAGGRSNLTYDLTDGTTRWVLRRPPLGGLTPSAHDMAREYRVAAALAGTDVPVARTVALAGARILGVPFAVMEYVDGTVIRSHDDLNRLSPDDIHRCAYRLVDVLANLHAIDPTAVGLGDFGRPAGYLARQVRRWQDQWHRVRTRRVDDVDRLHSRLTEKCPAEYGASIVHGDFRIDNAIFDAADPTVVRAVVDWEMATLGDPLADLGLHLAYRDVAFEPVLAGSAASTSVRLPSAAEIADYYANATGFDLGRLPFYLALGYFKIAVIAEGIHSRLQQGMTRGTGFERVGQAVAPLAAAGLRALQPELP